MELVRTSDSWIKFFKTPLETREAIEKFVGDTMPVQNPLFSRIITHDD